MRSRRLAVVADVAFVVLCNQRLPAQCGGHVFKPVDSPERARFGLRRNGRCFRFAVRPFCVNFGLPRGPINRERLHDCPPRRSYVRVNSSDHLLIVRA